MKLKVLTLFYLIVLVIVLTVAAPFVSSKHFGVYAQNNQISGYVFGLNRKPMDRLNVELLNDFYQTIGRTLTNGSGYYQFQGMRYGRVTVKVHTLGTDYEEQENSLEIYNPFGGAVYEQSDFQLRLRRGVSPVNAAVFAQDVPPEAQKLYDSAIDDLQNKRNTEGLQKLRDALTIFPKYFAALERLGIEYIQLGSTGSLEVAAGLLNMAVEINPRGFKSWLSFAFALNRLQNYPEAIAAAEKAVALNQSSVDALFLYGRLLRNAKKYSEAEKQLVKAKGLSTGVPAELHLELALLYGENLEKYAEAAKELKLYLKLNPNAANAKAVQKLIADFEAKATKK